MHATLASGSLARKIGQDNLSGALGRDQGFFLA